MIYALYNKCYSLNLIVFFSNSFLIENAYILDKNGFLIKASVFSRKRTLQLGKDSSIAYYIRQIE